jgi:RNA-directed DNA polymerase
LVKNNKVRQGAGIRHGGESDLKNKGCFGGAQNDNKMKRHGGLYDKICSIENLMQADELAGKGKLKRREIRRHRCRQAVNLEELREILQSKAYKTSEYKHFKIYEPKERDIAKLPYYPDLIAHHAVMNVLEGILVPTFTADTYSGIKRRGIHKAANALKRALKDRQATTYCLKLDISKFYPNVDHGILKGLLRRKLKDNELLWLLDEIIDSHPGLPIGNYLSIYLANLYLTGFDHWIKEVKGVKYYFRYADDMVILSGDKAFLHQLRKDIQKYLAEYLRLNLKGNWQVFPVAARGIDVIGYVFYHTHVLLRKSIKQRCCRTLKKKNRKRSSLAAHAGWMKHCNSRHLQKKLLIHEELQRLRDTERASRTDGGENKNRENTQPANCCSLVPYQGFDTQKGREVSAPANRAKWREASCILCLEGADGNNTVNPG